MPIIVAAAGAGLGGALGGYLKKNDKASLPDAMPQLDVTAPLNYLQSGTGAVDYYSQLGSGLYQNQLVNARDEIQKGYSDSIATLQPDSQAGQDAMNEMMRMLGMDPIQSTANFDTRLQGLQLSGDTSPLQSLITQATNEKDPTQRAALKSQVLDQLRAAPVVDNTALFLQGVGPIPQYQYAGVQNVDPKTGKPIVDAGPRPIMQTTTQNPNDYGKLKTRVDEQARQALIDNANYTYQMQLQDWKRQQAQTIAAEKANVQNREYQRNNLAADFENSYTPNYDAAYTGQQVTDKIEATPGYKFELDQGTKAVERQGAALGMLGSGNTLMALQNYGTKVGDQYFNTHMGNLASIAQAGLPATSAIAANQTTLGSNLGSLDIMKGQNQSDTFSNIGNTINQNTSSMAQYAYDRAKYDADAAAGIMAQHNALAKQAIASGAGYMSAQTQQQALNYKVAQNQQGGQAYFAQPGNTGNSFY